MSSVFVLWFVIHTICVMLMSFMVCVVYCSSCHLCLCYGLLYILFVQCLCRLWYVWYIAVHVICVCVVVCYTHNLCNAYVIYGMCGIFLSCI